MAVKRVHVYDTRTGRKLRSSVPETHLQIFPFLREIPSRRETDGGVRATPSTRAAITGRVDADATTPETPVPVTPDADGAERGPVATTRPDRGQYSGTAALTEED